MTLKNEMDEKYINGLVFDECPWEMWLKHKRTKTQGFLISAEQQKLLYIPAYQRRQKFSKEYLQWNIFGIPEDKRNDPISPNDFFGVLTNFFHNRVYLISEEKEYKIYQPKDYDEKEDRGKSRFKPLVCEIKNGKIVPIYQDTKRFSTIGKIVEMKKKDETENEKK